MSEGTAAQPTAQKTVRKRGRGADPASTRQDLVAAAFESIRTLGFSGTTARSIGALAGCNQAAIYYHFDGIEPLLILALTESSQRRLDRYREVLDQPLDLSSLVRELAALYTEDRASGHLDVLAELMGGVTASPGLRIGIEEAIGPWLLFVEDQIRRTASTVPFGAAIPAADLADLVFSLVIGLEIRSRIDARDHTGADRAERLFRMAGLLAALVPRPG